MLPIFTAPAATAMREVFQLSVRPRSNVHLSFDVITVQDEGFHWSHSDTIVFAASYNSLSPSGNNIYRNCFLLNPEGSCSVVW